MRFRLFLFATVWLGSFALSVAAQPAVTQPGGWSPVSVTDEGVVAAAAFAMRAKQAALGEEGDQGKLALEEIEAAEQQVVQGLNYRLMLRVLHNGKAHTAEAVVWARVWLDEAERYQLTSWRFTDATPKADRLLR